MKLLGKQHQLRVKRDALDGIDCISRVKKTKQNKNKASVWKSNPGRKRTVHLFKMMPVAALKRHEGKPRSITLKSLPMAYVLVCSDLRVPLTVCIYT